MARPENPLPQHGGPVVEAASWLRKLRDHSGMRNCDIAAVLGLSESTVSRALSGRTAPPAGLVFAMALLCDGSHEECIDVLGGLAQRRRAHRGQPIEGLVSYDPDLISTPAGLIRAMRALRVSVGQPSLALLQRRSPGRSLAPTTLNEVLLGQRMPSAPVLAAFLVACRVQPIESERWAQAWKRVMLHEQESARSSPRPYSHVVSLRLALLGQHAPAGNIRPFQAAHAEITEPHESH
ncbi:helix-turn-helix domain-containing protein [Streptomyces sp. NPDC057654]|uniref:helix-turn-helix domain-containing protein n=1 Tax=Streptomyces sp. NPDC057654 TaxID=3346196 RepID=UPI0036C0F504